MEDSKYLNDLRKEMLDPAKHGTKLMNIVKDVLQDELIPKNTPYVERVKY